MSHSGKNGKKKQHVELDKKTNLLADLTAEVKIGIFAILYFCVAIILILSFFDLAGPVGEALYHFLNKLVGIGYFLLPLSLLILSIQMLKSRTRHYFKSAVVIIGLVLMVLSLLGIIDIIHETQGGYLGRFSAMITIPFGVWAGVIILICVFIIGILMAFEKPLSFAWFLALLPKKNNHSNVEAGSLVVLPEETLSDSKQLEEIENNTSVKTEKLEAVNIAKNETHEKELNLLAKQKFANYKLPPIDLLENDSGKPTVGDVRANANIIKRTLQNFGIEVEMGEICIGPTVTQYTLKPAEGVKLSRITALQNDLSLALAAHPLRIEAPIPGKSLVGIEVPNKSVALVKLRNMLSTEEFQTSKALLLVPLGRDVSNKARYINIAKMPHLLIAGATGTGKSVCIHTIITSLLFRNTPETLRFILIDPKRVELSHYEGIPHLLTPVITECKKALPALRWAISEMERRYGLLLANHSRDIESYNEKISKKDVDVLPYIIIIIDELADLMMQYGKEVEGAIVRLAQMSRATGIHLVISTQRPSVEVITGLIKANITSRIAFQVASQVDSRTILDSQGAEKLLGHGDMLYLAADTSKPVRLQGAFLTENEVNRVTNFIRKQDVNIESNFGLETTLKGQEILNNKAPNQDSINLDEYAYGEEDEKYEEALEVIKQFGKASASLLQRRLGIGYARAAKLLDILEEKGIIGPADGAKPREVFLSNSQVWKNTSTKESLLDSSDTENLLDDNNEQDDNNEKI